MELGVLRRRWQGLVHQLPYFNNYVKWHSPGPSCVCPPGNQAKSAFLNRRTNSKAQAMDRSAAAVDLAATLSRAEEPKTPRTAA